MTRYALLASLLLAAAPLATPAAAQSAALAFAFEHFNQDYDSRDDIRRLPSSDNRVVISTRSSSRLGQAFTHFNQDFDTVSDLRGLRGATVYRTRPAFGGSQFDAIRAESLENE